MLCWCAHLGSVLSICNYNYHNTILTIHTVGLSHENVLVIAGQLLVADHKGHSPLRVVEDLSEWSLLPLQVEILELHLVQTDGEINVGEIPDNLNG